MKGPGDTAAVAAFTSAFFVARIPPLLFQAVQGTLLPKLASLAGAGRTRRLPKLASNSSWCIVVGIAVVGTLAAFTIGVPVGKILFPPFKIDSLDLGLLAAGSGMFIIALTVAQALLALKGHAPAALAWLLGVVVVRERHCHRGAVHRPRDAGRAGVPRRRVGEHAVMAVSLYARMKRGVPAGGIEGLIDQIEHEPLEI